KCASSIPSAMSDVRLLRPSAGRRTGSMDDPGRTCTVQLGSGPLTYHLRRTRRRSIGLVIRDEGLLIQAPLGATRQQIESAISHKAAWIRAKLQARDQRLARLDEQARQWREGGR